MSASKKPVAGGDIKRLIKCELNGLRIEVKLQEVPDPFRVIHIQAEVEKMSVNTVTDLFLSMLSEPQTAME